MRTRVILFGVFMMVSLSISQDKWTMVSGEFSVISQIKGKISRDNVRTVISYNAASGQIRIPEPKIDQNGRLGASWVLLQSPIKNDTPIQVLFAEHMLISNVSKTDIDGESLYGPFLIRKDTGKMWRLMNINGKYQWRELPQPPEIRDGIWRMFAAEHTASVSGMHRQNMYSVFLFEQNSGTTYMIQSDYAAKEGKIIDRLLPVTSGSTIGDTLKQAP